MSEPTNCITLRVNPKVLVKCLPTQAYQLYTYTLLMGVVVDEGSCGCVEMGGIWEITVPSSQLWYKLKTA